jgi:hypothetical protein
MTHEHLLLIPVSWRIQAKPPSCDNFCAISFGGSTESTHPVPTAVRGIPEYLAEGNHFGGNPALGLNRGPGIRHL